MIAVIGEFEEILCNAHIRSRQAVASKKFWGFKILFFQLISGEGIVYFSICS